MKLERKMRVVPNRTDKEGIIATRCDKCEHFFITWITGTPYGCSAWRIRTPRHPHVAVYASSGIECQLFKPKKRGKPAPRTHSPDKSK